MGRINFERLIHISYSENTINFWKIQSNEFKSTCEKIGKPFGYTGINVFVFFLYMYAIYIMGYKKYKAFWKKGEDKPEPQP